jgi:hypothetical protein
MPVPRHLSQKTVMAMMVNMPKKNRAAGRLTTISILKSEDELTSLCDKLNDPTLTKESEAAANARIDEICAQLYPVDSKVSFNVGGKIATAAERFRILFMRRWGSSGDWVEYFQERNRLFAQAAQEPAQKQNEHLKNLNSERWDHDSRNMQMAREFLKLRGASNRSDTKLKKDIGDKYGLKRSQSIEAIDRGIKLLDQTPGSAPSRKKRG